MSEQDGRQFSIKQHRNRKTKTSNQQNGKQPLVVQRPANDDKEAWKAYWKAQGQYWRTEPEIDAQRQKYLEKRRRIEPDIQQGIYPFRDIEPKLTRADVEWLLATHENGRGPVNWRDESQRERVGLDLRGVDIEKADLSHLPLACLCSEFNVNRPSELSIEQLKMAIILANGANLSGAQLEGANLYGAQLQEANLSGAQLQGANLTLAQLLKADLSGAQLQGVTLTLAQLPKADLSGAQLEEGILLGADLSGAYLRGAQLQGANLWAQLQGANLSEAQLQGAILTGATLIGANLSNASLKQASLMGAQLEGANLNGVQLQGANLADLRLSDAKGISPPLADVQLRDTNLAVVDWTQVKIIGDEYLARQKRDSEGNIKENFVRFRQYRRALRANRQLAVALREQGMNEEADYFAYRALILQRKALWWQIMSLRVPRFSDTRQNKGEREEGEASEGEVAAALSSRESVFQSLLLWLKNIQRFGQLLGRLIGAYFFSAFLTVLTGYGFRMGRIILAYILLICGFATAYWSFGVKHPRDISITEALIVSVTAFHGRVFTNPFMPNIPDTQVVITAIEAIFGLVFEGVFIAMLTQRFFRR